ncbi:MAG: hypothetical protein EDX89_16960 [Acidobacteria bacterium]|nr:MAG: hypothetical protein EDX89_16960 [Acidobacteriota bacterium]MCE7959152.1 hypothetical protein [Acidobacteria bacterium ACB2]
MSDSVPGDCPDTPRRRAVTPLRLAGLGLASLLALSTPLDDAGSLNGDEPVPELVRDVPGATELPAGWPGAIPELNSDHEWKIWNRVFDQCERFGISDEALVMYHVLWEESRLLPHVRSACGRYLGIGQFVPRTFRANVAEMKKHGLLAEDVRYSPFDPDQAIEVMAFMWSRGHQNHWGPWRRVSRRLARESAADPALAPVAIVASGPLN